MDNSKKMIYKQSEVCELFGIHRTTLQIWCRKGVLNKVKVPGVRRSYISAESVEKFVKSR